MPWHVAKSGSCPDSKPWAVVKDTDGGVVACHATEEEAKKQMAALYANEPSASSRANYTVEQNNQCPDRMPWAVMAAGDDTPRACHVDEESARKHMQAMMGGAGGSGSSAQAMTTVETRAAIASHSTATSTGAWDGPAAEARLPNDAGAATFRRVFAWVDPNGDSNTKAAYRFIHHETSSNGAVGAANVAACTTGIGVLNGGRGGSTIPSADRQGVYNHLARHVRDAGREPAPLRAARAAPGYERVERVLPMLSPELREDGGGGGEGTGRRMAGLFAVFDRTTEIKSVFEGHFRERVAKGAFARTLRANEGRIRALYAHGRHPMFGDLPIGAPQVLREDVEGAYAEVELFDTPLNRDYLVPALRAKQLGMSFSFDVIKDEWDDEPPDGDLPVRTIREVRLYEFGPTPFPAYADTTAGVRAVADHITGMSQEERSQLAQIIAMGTPLDGVGSSDEADRSSGLATLPPDPAHDHSEEQPPAEQEEGGVNPARYRQAVLNTIKWE